MNLRKSVMEKRSPSEAEIMDRSSDSPLKALEKSNEELVPEREYYNEKFLPNVTLRAVECGMEIQEKYPEYDSNEGFKLSLHIGIGAGTLNAIHVGGVDGFYEFLVVGDPIKQLETAVDNSNSGQVVISPRCYELIKDKCDASKILVKSSLFSSPLKNVPSSSPPKNSSLFSSPLKNFPTSSTPKSKHPSSPITSSTPPPSTSPTIDTNKNNDPNNKDPNHSNQSLNNDSNESIDKNTSRVNESGEGDRMIEYTENLLNSNMLDSNYFNESISFQNENKSEDNNNPLPPLNIEQIKEGEGAENKEKGRIETTRFKENVLSPRLFITPRKSKHSIDGGKLKKEGEEEEEEEGVDDNDPFSDSRFSPILKEELICEIEEEKCKDERTSITNTSIKIESKGILMETDYLVTNIKEKSTPIFTGDFHLNFINEDALRCYVPRYVQQKIDSDQSEWIAELRQCTVIFIKLPQLSCENESFDLQKIHQTLRFMQAVIFKFEGIVRQFLVDGFYFFLFFNFYIFFIFLFIFIYFYLFLFIFIYFYLFLFIFIYF